MNKESPYEASDDYQRWLHALGRSARIGCVTLLIAGAAGGSSIYAGLALLSRLGVTISQGAVPFSVQIEMVGPCSRETLGGTQYPWEQVLFSRTYGINPHTGKSWSAPGEGGFRTCPRNARP